MSDDASAFPYKDGVGSGVSFGEGHALAVPSWLLFLVLLGMLGFLAYVVQNILKMAKEREESKDKAKAEKKKKKEERRAKKKGSGSGSDSDTGKSD